MVGRARKLYKVEYPAMYSDTEQVFNCYQRVHQNTLERVTVFLVLLLAAGLFNAKMAAAFGFIWIAGRIIYSIGYYSGIPKNRIVGSFVSFTKKEIINISHNCLDSLAWLWQKSLCWLWPSFRWESLPSGGTYHRPSNQQKYVCHLLANLCILYNKNRNTQFYDDISVS